MATAPAQMPLDLQTAYPNVADSIAGLGGATVTTYERGHALDKEMILGALEGKSLQRYPLFHTQGVPTYRGALKLASERGILRTDKVVIRPGVADAYQNPHIVYHVALEIQKDDRSLFGASQDADAYVALERSFQNGVRQLLFDEDGKPKDGAA